jgi:hypothetical protein
MAIRLEAEKYFEGCSEERELAMKLDGAFEITFRISGSDGLSFWLGEPKALLKERFGIQQEVLIIYSPHPQTDLCILTTIEDAMRSPDFKQRVEKVILFLIHKGDGEDTKQIVKQAVERIVVPFRVDELQNPARGEFFLSSKIAGAIGAIDLFGMTSAPTSDNYFFGRDELVQRLITELTVQKENSGLFGLRKTGKTSVLRAIQRRIEGQHTLTEYIECSHPDLRSAHWWQALENIIAKCAETLKRDFQTECNLPRNYSSTNAGTRFVADIKTMIETAHLRQIVLMFDEIEFITQGSSRDLRTDWDQDFVPFWQTLKSAHQETRGAFVFIVAGINPACAKKAHFGTIPNPLFHFVVSHYLEPLSVSAVKEMVMAIGKYAGLEFSEDTFAYLHSTYGGHPLLTRMACSEVWKSRDILNPTSRTLITIRQLDELKPEIKERLAPHNADILRSLVWWYPEEAELLQILAARDNELLETQADREQKTVSQFARYGNPGKDNSIDLALSDIKAFFNKYSVN